MYKIAFYDQANSLKTWTDGEHFARILKANYKIFLNTTSANKYYSYHYYYQLKIKSLTSNKTKLMDRVPNRSNN